MRTFESIVLGTVTLIDAELARIKVMFNFMNPPQESEWAPVASPHAGNNRGLRFMPERDDEVLVAFDRGDFAHPYVVGFLWSKVKQAPDDNHHNRVIVTPGGHQLRFEDQPGAKKVILQSAGGLTITMDDTRQSIELRGGGRAVTMQAGQVRIT